MSTMIRTEIIHSVNYDLCENYLLRNFQGEVTMRTIINSWEFLIPEYYRNDRRFVMISDYREAVLKVNLEDNRLMQDFLLKNIDKFYNMIIAQVLNNSDIVYPMIFNMNNPEIWSRAFSSMDAALEWIGYY